MSAGLKWDLGTARPRPRSERLVRSTAGFSAFYENKHISGERRGIKKKEGIESGQIGRHESTLNMQELPHPQPGMSRGGRRRGFPQTERQGERGR